MKNILFVIIMTFISLQTSYGADKCMTKLKGLNLCVTVDFLKPATRKDDAKFKLIFTNAKGQRIVPSHKLDAHLWMVMKNGHAHGSEKLKIEKKKDHYLISNVWFLMLGDWSINFKLTDGKKARAIDSGKIDLCLARKPKDNHFGKCK